MEKLYVLGTGNAMVTRCYNTCFALYDGQEYFMVDAGGGNGILRILQDMNMDPAKIHHIFVTHEHTDHILGMPWMIRKVGEMMLKQKYVGNLTIYCHAGLVKSLRTICELTLQKKVTRLFDERILFVPVEDAQTCQILQYPVTFFDIHSTKAPQFGFTTRLLNGKRFTCMGDEPYSPTCEQYVKNSDWLLSEAFCLYGERETFKPYEKHHSTVKDACELAQQLNVKNLVLWHTEDTHISERKALYTAEGKEYFDGNLFVPNDQEILEL